MSADELPKPEQKRVSPGHPFVYHVASFLLESKPKDATINQWQPNPDSTIRFDPLISDLTASLKEGDVTKVIKIPGDRLSIAIIRESSDKEKASSSSITTNLDNGELKIDANQLGDLENILVDCTSESETSLKDKTTAIAQLRQKLAQLAQEKAPTVSLPQKLPPKYFDLANVDWKNLPTMEPSITVIAPQSDRNLR